MKLGIFDSGVGGEAVALSLATAFPTADIITVNDREHLPYGDRTADDITRLTDRAIQPLLTAQCDIIVIACNSASAAALETLRASYPTQKFIGLEPMIKPAAQMTKSGVVAVCATPATLSSKRYQTLKQEFASGITVLEPDCSTWAHMIEDSELNEHQLKQTIDNVIDTGADVIVLACTHYHWISETIEEIAKDSARVIYPTTAIIARVTELTRDLPSPTA